MTNRQGKNGKSGRLVTAATKLRHLLLGRKTMTNLNSILKNRDITLMTKVWIVKVMVSPVIMYQCENWTIKKAEHWRIAAFTIVVLEKTTESPLDSKEIQSVHPKGNQPWIFIRRTDAEAEAPILWPPDLKRWLIGKHPDSGKDWRPKEKGVTEDEIIGWHHQLNGHTFAQTPGDSEGQGSLGAAVHGVPKSWTWLSDWKTIVDP